jgi:hypothetical protein
MKEKTVDVGKSGAKVVFAFGPGGGRLAGTTTKAVQSESNGKATVPYGSAGTARVIVNGTTQGTTKCK